MSRLIALIIATILSSGTLAQTPIGVSSQPSVCHALTTVHPDASDGDAPEYVKRKQQISPLRKADVVCVGNNLEINTDIVTSGGNVYIFGNTVKINSTIDTRVYRPYSIESHFVDPTAGAPYPAGNSSFAFWNTWGLLTSGREPFTVGIKAAFERYYACEKCRADDDGRLAIARMPDGLTPPMANGPLTARAMGDFGTFLTNGLPPNASLIDHNVYKSGSVYIFAVTLQLGSTAHLIASGLPGGIGGAGQPPSCIGQRWESSGFSCASNGYTTSGLSAPGGKGGDAGSIYLSIARPGEISSSAQAEFVARAEVAGGASGPTAKLLSPHEGAPEFVKVGDWPEAGQGASGTVLVTSSPTGLSQFVSMIQSRDALLSYDLQDYAATAQFDKSKKFITLTDYVTESVHSVLYERMASIISATTGAFNSGNVAAYDARMDAFCGWRDATISDAPVAMLDALSRIRRLCNVSGSSAKELLSEYLIATGGLFNVADIDAFDTLQTRNIRTSISESQETWAGILSSLSNIEGRLLEIFVSTERTRYFVQIRDAKARLADAEAQLRSMQQSSGGDASKLFALAGKLGTMGTGYGELWEALDLLDEGKTSAGAERFGKGGAIVAEAWSEFAAILGSDAGSDLGGTEAQIALMKRTLSEIELSQRAMVADMERQRSEIVRRELLTLSDVIGARSTTVSQVQARVSLFDDLLKLSIATYILDPAKDFSKFAQNAMAMLEFSATPRSEPRLSLRRLNSGCGTDARPTCLMVARTESQQAIYYVFMNRMGRFIEIPLYVIAPGAGNVMVDTYGIPPDELAVREP